MKIEKLKIIKQKMWNVPSKNGNTFSTVVCKKRKEKNHVKSPCAYYNYYIRSVCMCIVYLVYGSRNKLSAT